VTSTLGLAGALLLGGCEAKPARVPPSIELSTVPEANEGGADRLDTIEGRVTGASPGQQVVLYARAGAWWVQPLADQPFTKVQPNSTWRSTTHLGTEYAALLVEPGYRPPSKADVLPQPGGGGVVAIVTAKGRPASPTTFKVLQFSGYQWKVRTAPSDRGGSAQTYDAENAWTDESGALHLRIAKRGGRWTCGEVSVMRSFGYGTYAFVVRDTSHLEPAAVLGLFTWDDLGVDQRHRELDIEMSRWGDPASNNAQYVVQPYYVPANVARFIAPPGLLTHSLRWEPGRASFRTSPGATHGARSPVVAERTFTSGVPVPGGETVHINLYVFGHSRVPLEREVEVVVEKFEYLP
jgi:hypothetical protein